MSVESYEAVKRYHKLLFALIEMRDLEAFVAKEIADIEKRTDHPQAKMVFTRWAQESDGHRKALQNAIDKLQEKTLTNNCKTCMEDALATSYSNMRMLELREHREKSITIKELYTLLKKHLKIEGDVERRYAQMAEMPDNEEIKNILMTLSNAEKEHHSQAQQLIDVLEKVYGEKLKEL